jgi:hypothetical protein
VVQTHAADAVVFPSQVGVAHPHWGRLAARPEVAKLATWDLLFGNINGVPGGVLFGSTDGSYLGAVDKPVVVQGRMYNPHAANEVVLDENSAGGAPPVGGTFVFRPYAKDQPDGTGQPRGPNVTMHVVGIVREVPEFLVVSEGQSELGPLSQDVSPPLPPVELTNLHNICTLPEVLAGFLGLIAVAALGSVLLSCARRRRRDFAMLRAPGMTRGNVRTVLNAQGTAIGLFGLIVGIPLGLVVGRLGWAAIASRVPLAEIAPFALVAIVLIIPATIVAANVLALWPGRVTLSHLPADELRAE